MIDRQKLIGWIIILWSAGYIVWMLKVRILADGPMIERKEWIYFWLSFGGLILGTINIRMANARLRGEVFVKPQWLASGNDNGRDGNGDAGRRRNGSKSKKK